MALRFRDFMPTIEQRRIETAKSIAVVNLASTAGRVLAGLGVNFEKVHRVIEGKTPVAAPTASRIFDVYVSAGPDGDLSAYKRSVLYPTAAAAQEAHPGATTVALQVPLNDGEFFDVGIPSGRIEDFNSWASFANCADAFAAAKSYKETQGGNVSVKLMVPELREFRGTDGDGNEVVLGNSTTYHRTSLVSRLAATVE
jgi:hypothetical protein